MRFRAPAGGVLFDPLRGYQVFLLNRGFEHPRHRFPSPRLRRGDGLNPRQRRCGPKIGPSPYEKITQSRPACSRRLHRILMREDPRRGEGIRPRSFPSPRNLFLGRGQGEGSRKRLPVKAFAGQVKRLSPSAYGSVSLCLRSPSSCPSPRLR